MNIVTNSDDDLITLRELRKGTAGRSGDGRLNIRTLHRFILKGVKGRRLWAMKTPAGWVTTARAWREFLHATDEALRTGVEDRIGETRPVVATPGERARRLAKIDAELQARGL